MMREQYLFEDPAAAAIPAQNSSLRIDSHGSRIFGRVLMPGADSPETRTPTVVFLHGYPGVEKNLDIPQALRRTGVATVEFSYRGVWGSHGYYCLSHLIEDAETVLDTCGRMRIHTASTRNASTSWATVWAASQRSMCWPGALPSGAP